MRHMKSGKGKIQCNSNESPRFLRERESKLFKIYFVLVVEVAGKSFHCIFRVVFAKGHIYLEVILHIYCHLQYTSLL